MTFKAGQSTNLNGRPKGSKNKQTLTAIGRLEALGCDPIEGMARIFMDEAADLSIRAQMYKELVQYIAPKRKAVGRWVKAHRNGDTEAIKAKHRLLHRIQRWLSLSSRLLSVSPSRNWRFHHALVKHALRRG
jgi:hypothetical protein